MARNRMIKPEFWEDEIIGLLSFGARLLFIGMWNIADDEGLLRFNSAYLKSSIFIYDDISLNEVEKFMSELENNNLIFVYTAGLCSQKYCHIIKFKKHQKIDKPQPSKLPLPSEKKHSSTNSSNHSTNHSSTNSLTNIKEKKRREEKRKEENPFIDSSSTSHCHYDFYLNCWNEKIKGKLSTILKLTESRKDKIKIREKTDAQFKEHFEIAVNKILENKFLLGDNDKNWQVSFDWIIENDKNYLKILEGAYRNKSFSFNKKMEDIWNG